MKQQEFRVPVNLGHVLGNALRQVAIRGVFTWRIASYKIAPKDKSFGISGDNHFSFLEFTKGILVSKDKPMGKGSMKLMFEKQGDVYVNGDFVIQGLGHLNAPSMEVCLVSDSGIRSAEENRKITMELASLDCNDFVCVPSRHSSIVHFSFDVTPFSEDEETLSIRFSDDCLYDAMKQLESLLASVVPQYSPKELNMS